MESVITLFWILLGGMLVFAIVSLFRRSRARKRGSERRSIPRTDYVATRQTGPSAPGAATSSSDPSLRAFRRIFISYRRDDSGDVAGRIYDRLVQSIGAANVFKDVDSVPLGVDFRQHIDTSIGQSDVMLLLIGDRFISPAGVAGSSRLRDPNDVVRLEVESALRRRLRIIPVLVRGAHIPAEHDLPPSIAQICYLNALVVRPDPDFHRDVDRLLTGIKASGEA